MGVAEGPTPSEPPNTVNPSPPSMSPPTMSPKTASPQQSSSPTSTNLPRLQRVEFLYTATPVEGCDLLPYVVLRTPSGEVKSAESIEAKTRGALSVQYRWNRCAATYSCANKHCFKPAQIQFVPLLKAASDYILPSEQYENVIKQSFFCSTECLKAAWSGLRLFVQNIFATFPRREENDLSHDDKVAAARSHCVIGRNDGVFKDPLPNPIQVTEVAFIRNYAPTADDVGHVLELVCRYVQRNADGTVHVGPPLSIRSSAVLRTPDPPPDRRMFNLSTGEFYNISNRRPGTFRVLSYNILAEIYATKESFPEKQCPSWALAWTFRKRRLISEMSKYDCDLLCLQEVQADHFEDHFQPYFSRKGYESCFKGKTREAMGRRGKIDGCATFYRKDLFSLREQFVVEYNTIAQARTKDPRTLNRVLKGNVGQILILDTYDGSGQIVVANTHLYWDPELADVKLFQMDAFMQELELLIQTRGLPQDVPIILAGDLNSTPDSAVYELLSNGACMLSKSDVPDDSHLLSTCRLRHNLRMRSSYSHMGGEPGFTNYTFTFKGVLDYIWYGTDSIAPTAVLEIPTEISLVGKHAIESSANTDELGIPNEQWSSDHIGLVADFQLLKRSSLAHTTM